MKKITSLVQASLLAAFVLALTPALRASDLENEMKVIGKNTKALKAAVGDPAKKAEALAEIGLMIKSAEKARTLTPKKAAEIPAAARSQFIADYQKQIDVMISQFKQIQADLTSGTAEAAKSDFEKLGGIKRDGHEKFAAKE